MTKTWGRWGQFTIERSKESLLSRTRFDEKTGCLIWTGSKIGGGRYGMFGMMGRMWLVHRAAWVLFKGFDPKEKCVCHRCDNCFCVNIDHLFLGTHTDNMRDMESKNRSRHPTAEEHGRSKLNWDKVLTIRKLHSEGHAIRAIARMFPFVNRTTVSAVVHHRSWITT